MKKRKGVALISVLVLFVFVIGLSMALMGAYLSSVKQSSNARITDQLNYASMSGVNIVSSYIINTNAEFLTKYNEFLSSNGNNRSKPFVIELNQDNYELDVSVTSTFSQVTNGGVVTSTIVYHLSSVASFNGKMSLPTTLDIEQKNSEGNNKFTVGKFQQ